MGYFEDVALSAGKPLKSFEQECHELTHFSDIVHLVFRTMLQFKKEETEEQSQAPTAAKESRWQSGDFGPGPSFWVQILGSGHFAQMPP